MSRWTWERKEGRREGRRNTGGREAGSRGEAPEVGTTFPFLLSFSL